MFKIWKHPSEYKTSQLILLNIIVTLIISLMVISLVNVGVMSSRRAQTLHQLQSYADNQITNRINKHIFFTSIWETMIIQDDGKVVDFQSATNRIVRDYGQEEIEGVILAPKGIVEYVYGNDKRMMKGRNLLATEFSKTNAVRAQYTGLTTMSEFYREKDDTYSLYIYNPVYINKSGSMQFWGFSILALKVPDLFNGIGFVGLGNRIDFQLSGAVEGIDGETVYLSSTSDDLCYPVDYYFSVPNGTWHFAASWNGGWITASEKGIEAAVLLLVVIMTWILTALHRKEAELKNLSRSDALTGMFNRRGLRAAFNLIASENGELSAIFIDIDDFKSVNDEDGHEYGDKALKILADRLIEAFGHNHCFRYGGDEFLVISPGRSMEEIEKELNIVNEPIYVSRADGTIRTITISGGHARSTVNSADDLRDLIRNADTKLYEAKTKGKNRILE